MAENFGLVRKSMRPKLGRRSFFTPEGKVALMFLKMYTGLSCTKLLWEGVEKSYATMCELSSRLGIHRPLTKFLDVQKVNLKYRKQRKHNKSKTRKITRRLLDLLGKILKEIREIVRNHENAENLLTVREKSDIEIITKMYRLVYGGAFLYGMGCQCCYEFVPAELLCRGGEGWCGSEVQGAFDVQGRYEALSASAVG